MQPPKRRLSARIERDEEVHLSEDENAHLWAVSYSDFLMALLSFFILFFSMESSPQKEDFIRNLAQEFGGAPSESSGPEASRHGYKQSLRAPAAELQKLNSLELKVEAEDHGNLVINFPDDLYNPGQHSFRLEKADLVKKVLNTLHPYQSKVRIYFEGHADNTPLKLHRNDIVTDNFVLSSLRANSALAIARVLGFSEKEMFIQAASSNVRNSRSLSIRIQPMEGQAL